jgi:RNA polymerase sigma-70 factor (ECF subfamily)
MTTTAQVGEVAMAAANGPAGQDALYESLAAEYAAPLARLARAYEADGSLQQDLLQEIHLALWRSLASFGGRCSMRTWVYRVAHNAAVTHVQRSRRRTRNLVAIDDVEIASDAPEVGAVVDDTRMLARIHALLPRLKPIDREVFVLHLEGLSLEEIADITGVSRTNTGTKVHRIRALFAARLQTKDAP